MDEKGIEQITESTQRLAAAAEALEKAMVEISAQQAEISAKIDKIVAAIEEGNVVGEPALSAQTAERTGHPAVHAGRKTLSPMMTTILAKSGAEDETDLSALDKALGTLAPEQRIAVKTEMARAGIIQ